MAFSSKWYLATFAFYFVIRKKIVPWWKKVSHSPIFIFLCLMVALSIVHLCLLRPPPLESPTIKPVQPVNQYVAAAPAALPVIPAAAVEKPVKQTWLDSLEKVKGNVLDKWTAAKKQGASRQKEGLEPFEDFAQPAGRSVQKKDNTETLHQIGEIIQSNVVTSSAVPP
ncbi:hypothetical protein BDR26DRAFT_933800 [Obelidium mucronatum]|nr:hypothetical protein BDR26DRAFT_933800 [Obelidium mucronatum]